MTKKIVTLLVALFLICTTSFVFAAENAGSEVQDSLNKAGHSVGNAVNGTGNVVRDGVGAIEKGLEDLGNTFTSGASRVTNNNANRNNNYSTTRTATGTTFAGMSANTWTWFILAIAGIAIVGLIWYYSMQNTTERRTNHND